ncbi:hypothetical protein AAC387_Pa03g0869 [Persea americana]
MREGEQQRGQKSSTRSGEHLEIGRDDAREAGSTERETSTREGVQKRESSIDERRSAAGELLEISTSDAERERSSLERELRVRAEIELRAIPDLPNHCREIDENERGKNRHSPLTRRRKGEMSSVAKMKVGK